MAWSAFRRVLAVATDRADVPAIAGRLVRCGLPVTYAIEARNVLTGMEQDPDVMVVHICPGQELLAFHAGTTARTHGVPVLFVVPNIRLPAIKSLTDALPSFEVIEHDCDDATLTAKVMALIIRNRRLP